VGSKYSPIPCDFSVARTGQSVDVPVQSGVHSRKFFLPLLAAFLVATLLMAPSYGQDDVHVVPRETKKAEAKVAPPPDADPSLKTFTKPLRKDVDLVLVPVTITDPMNRLVTGLEKQNFALTDNGQPQEIRHFSSEDAPISLGVIFDISGSMSDKIDKSRQAVVEFFRTANPQDEFFVITFNDKPELLVDYTS
jgi:Ca-activated chloride channel family protein